MDIGLFPLEAQRHGIKAGCDIGARIPLYDITLLVTDTDFSPNICQKKILKGLPSLCYRVLFHICMALTIKVVWIYLIQKSIFWKILYVTAVGKQENEE
ncbi:hypothetical protein IMSAGC020_02857 [Lachnospiraceae bacterium]|nr:hypothetical protein IMSAGC020_02857 [Lachnospiraceae bacterium]